jgi:hypothetical protein
MTVVQLETLGDSSNSDSSEDSVQSSAALLVTIVTTIFVGTLLISGGVSALVGSAEAAKTSTSAGSFVKNTLLNTVVGMLVILSLLASLFNSAVSAEADGWLVAFSWYPFLGTTVLLAIIYTFVSPRLSFLRNMGTRSKIMVYLLLFHVIYWSWMYTEYGPDGVFFY